MQTVDAAGARLNPKLFIATFRAVTKLAPARFLTLSIHPDRYKELYGLADIPESIQVGPVLGPMGRQIMKVNCIKPPLGVSDGITIVQDKTAPLDQLVFSIHGIPEYSLVNLATT
jgi:hypothetical protein